MNYAHYPSLKDRVVFITGGASGIGGDMVEQFVQQGSKVAFFDINELAATALIEKCRERGADLLPLFCQGDVANIDQLRDAINKVIEQLGPIQVLINNAASDDRHRMEDVEPDYWEERFRINLNHQFFAIQSVAPKMKTLESGSIINVGSSSWMIKEDFFPAYAVAKSAVQGLTRTMARTLGPHNIRVNTVLPGWVVTDRQLDKWWTEEGEQSCLDMQCLKKRVYPEEFNQMILFLAADDSGACTAQSYIVDAGRQ